MLRSGYFDCQGRRRRIVTIMRRV